MIPYRAPSFHEDAFNCPHCGAFSHQSWNRVYGENPKKGGMSNVGDCDLAYCEHCNLYSIWQGGRMVYPFVTTAPLPNPDLPEDIKADYEEARSIVSPSPRGAAALLRLVIQKLCKHLGEKGENLNDDIANLVKKGLGVQIQQALDVVRVIGNNAVHPGQIDLKDDAKTAEGLFGSVNLIAQVMITQPKQVAELYSKLPQGQRDQIEKRNAHR